MSSYTHKPSQILDTSPIYYSLTHLKFFLSVKLWKTSWPPQFPMRYRAVAWLLILKKKKKNLSFISVVHVLSYPTPIQMVGRVAAAQGLKRDILSRRTTTGVSKYVKR